MRIFANDRMAGVMDALGMQMTRPSNTTVSKAIENAQRRGGSALR